MEYNFLQFTVKDNPAFMEKYNGPIITANDPFLTSAAHQDSEEKKLKASLLAIRAKVEDYNTSLISRHESNDTEHIKHHDITHLTQEEAMSFINTISSDPSSNTSPNDVNKNHALASTELMVLDRECDSSQHINAKPVALSEEPSVLDNESASAPHINANPVSVSTAPKALPSSTDDDITAKTKRPASIDFYSPDNKKIFRISPSDAKTQTTSLCANEPPQSSSCQLHNERIFTSNIRYTYAPPSPAYNAEFLLEILKNLNKAYPTISYSQEYPDLVIGSKIFNNISAVCQTGLGFHGTAYAVSNPIARLILKQIDTRIKFAIQKQVGAISLPYTYAEVLTHCIMTHMEIMRKEHSRMSFIESIRVVTLHPSTLRYFQYKDTNPLHLDLSSKIGIVFLHEFLLFLYYTSSTNSSHITLTQNISITLQMLLHTLEDHDVNSPDDLYKTPSANKAHRIHIQDAQWLIEQLEELLSYHNVSTLYKQSDDKKSTYNRSISVFPLVDLLTIKDMFAKSYFYNVLPETNMLLTHALQQACLSFASAIANKDNLEAIDDIIICKEETQALKMVAQACSTYNIQPTSENEDHDEEESYLYISKTQIVSMLSLVDKVLQKHFPSQTPNIGTSHPIISAIKNIGLDHSIVSSMKSMLDHHITLSRIFLPIRFVVILRSLIRICRDSELLFPFYCRLYSFLNTDEHVIGKQGQRLTKEHASAICGIISIISKAYNKQYTQHE